MVYNKIVVVILGPTASGKTELGINVANEFKAEIISADSRQIYKGLYIGTAQPTFEERMKIKHHLIDFVELDRLYTVANYERDALDKIEELFEKNDTIVVVGGTGLYIDAICKGLDKIPEVSMEIKNEIDSLYKNRGLVYCAEQLKRLDKNCEKHVDLRNPSRVLRAFKVIRMTGEPIYSFFNKKKSERKFKTICIGIDVRRDVLYSRINKRVDLMIEKGLVDEVDKFKKYREFNSMKTIGYSEIFEYFDRKKTLNEAIDDIKRNTRNYAKRQMTWFRRDNAIKWFDKDDFSKILEYISDKRF